VKESCEECYYFVNNGFCHRYPPVYTYEPSWSMTQRWSNAHVENKDWCGEFKQMDKDG